ncbi:MAG: glycosyltransferase family 4 protein [bacterium]
MIVRNEFLPDSRVFNEAKALQSLGYNVQILAVRYDASLSGFEVMDGLPVHRVLLNSDPLLADFSSPMYHGVTIPLIAKAALRLECDIYHCHDLYTLPAGIWIRLLRGKSIIYDAHEPSYASLFSYVEGTLPSRVRWFIGEVSERFLSKFVSSFIVTTESARATKGRAGSMYTVPYRPDPQYFHPENRDENLERLYARHKTILYIGSLNEKKGLYEMLGALSLLKSKISEIKLIILGRLYVYEDISNVLKRYSIEDHVEIHPWVPYWDVPKYINASTLGVIPIHSDVRSYQMAMPNKLLDFMSCGVPVVCSALPEMKKIVEETGCGIVVDELSAQSLSAAIQDMLDSDLEVYSTNALRAASRQFNFEDMVSALRDVYEDLQER